MTKFSLIFDIFFLAALVHLTYGINVTSVHLASDAITARDKPRVMCNITLDAEETLLEVQWHHKNQLIYKWHSFDTIEVSGVLLERVTIPEENEDYSIHVNNIHIDMEGTFICTAITEQNKNASNTFLFTVYYRYEEVLSLNRAPDHCTLRPSFFYNAVYPKPENMICQMELGDSTECLFELILNGTESVLNNVDGTFMYNYTISDVPVTSYPAGSRIKCYTNLYGGQYMHMDALYGEIDNCFDYPPEIPDFKTDISRLSPGCRGGYNSASKIKYECEINPSLSKEISCNATAGNNGSWVPNLMVGGQWPICSEGNDIRKISLILLINTILVLVFRL